MKKTLTLVILIILIIVIAVSWLTWKGYQTSKEKEISILTYQKDYPEGENPKIKIKNNSTKTVCFSSCYPYYLESKNGDLKSYRYGSCPYSDVAEICMEAGEVKAFELLWDKMSVNKGLHRIAIPTCLGCTLQENFRKDKFFYSNEFIVK